MCLFLTGRSSQSISEEFFSRTVRDGNINNNLREFMENEKLCVCSIQKIRLYIFFYSAKHKWSSKKMYKMYKAFERSIILFISLAILRNLKYSICSSLHF